jgi:hypothetical protein
MLLVSFPFYYYVSFLLSSSLCVIWLIINCICAQIIISISITQNPLPA